MCLILGLDIPIIFWEESRLNDDKGVDSVMGN